MRFPESEKETPLDTILKNHARRMKKESEDRQRRMDCPETPEDRTRAKRMLAIDRMANRLTALLESEAAKSINPMFRQQMENSILFFRQNIFSATEQDLQKMRRSFKDLWWEIGEAILFSTPEGRAYWAGKWARRIAAGVKVWDDERGDAAYQLFRELTVMGAQLREEDMPFLRNEVKRLYNDSVWK